MATELIDFLQHNGRSFAERLGKDRWYLVVLSALTTGNHFAIAGGAIFKYATSQLEYASREQRQYLVERLREVLTKSIFVIGIPKSLESMISLAKEIDDVDIDNSIRSRLSPEETKARGDKLNDRIYQGEADAVFRLLEPHPDFMFAMMDIGYGMFFSDDSVLTNVESEIALLASLVVQNTPIEIDSHTKGLSRQGLDYSIIDQIMAVSEEMAAYMRLNARKSLEYSTAL
ncbi:Carboxymuconolactone decarboxylase [Akanthomyces lecanii RCEF 1005]|uniref:Carboxymuconolactone decarboxylase n=1 Tax=Akanthomyces lecanii RCEF 1005 TaxID=1081108 RepID=A0A162JX43_CORDF|nr:Carboxymuconolactone decarboxylase [Akanthomyces lecanii RCEF 1005]